MEGDRGFLYKLILLPILLYRSTNIINRLHFLHQNDYEHLMQLLIVRLCATAMDARVNRQLVMVVHSVDVDAGHETNGVISIQHRKKQTVILMYEGNHHRKIEHRMNLQSIFK